MKNKYLGKRRWFGVLLGALLVVCLWGCGKDTADYIESEVFETERESFIEEASQNDTSTAAKIYYVYVCGAVKNPGVYQMPEGSRIYDLFVAAGGLTKNAATDYWNQAKILEDGEMFYVPTIEEAAEQKENTISKESTSSQIVNINTASKEELMTLSGIGSSKALAIISYRQELGEFSCIEDIMKVEGIKDAVFQKIKDEIVVN